MKKKSMGNKFERRLGEGTEKNVFADPIDPDKVHAEYKEIRWSRRQVRASFYLTKILHLLLPQNIPDIYSSQYQPHKYVAQRKHLDVDHKALSDLRKRIETRGLSQEERDLWYALRGRHEEKIAKSQLRDKLTDLRIVFDQNLLNFSIEPSGEVVYLENFSPWTHKTLTPELKLFFDSQKLSEAIDNLDPLHREKGLLYLSRLNSLVEEESADIRAKHDTQKNNH